MGPGQQIRIPKAIQDAPELLPDLTIFWRAFWRLSTDRNVGMGVGPIPWSSIESYARSFGFDAQETAELHAYVRAMDDAYLEWHAKRSKRDGGSQ